MQYVVFLHGAGRRDPDYAQPLIDNIKPLIGSVPVTFNPIYYGDLLQPFETKMESEVAHSDLNGREHMKSIRSFFDEFTSDILQWYDLETQLAIKQRIRSSWPDCLTADVRLVAHSWGCVIADDILPPLYPIITLACPLRLVDYHAGWLSSLWTNFFHGDDLIASPLNGLFGCKDIEVTDAGPPDWIVGDIEVLGAGAAHTCYWTSRLVAKTIADQITGALAHPS